VFFYLIEFYPDVTSQTKSNVRLIKFNWTQSNSIMWLGPIGFSDRTQSNSNKNWSNQTQLNVDYVRLGSISSDRREGSHKNDHCWMTFHWKWRWRSKYSRQLTMPTCSTSSAQVIKFCMGLYCKSYICWKEIKKTKLWKLKMAGVNWNLYNLLLSDVLNW